MAFLFLGDARMRLIVTGGRDYTDSQELFGFLDEIHCETPITLLIHGAASGADTLAEEWAKSREVSYLGIPAKWKTGTQGKAEGVIRNRLLFDWEPDKVLAVQGGKGTASTVRIAQTLSVFVIDKRNKSKGGFLG